MSLLDVPISSSASMRRSKSVNSAHPRRPKQKKYVADIIDRLDDTSVGGHYHHGGPYDAAARSFNINPKFSPIAATREGNKAAWEATPREAQLDALLKGRPLDGVGVVPPGHRAMNGQVMQYEEGPDLMREMSPGGGAYKRWPGIQYHPDDLKGKGEPGFTIDNERKALEAAQMGRSRSTRDRERRGDYEMVPQRERRSGGGGKGHLEVPVLVRQRSLSVGDTAATSSRPSATVLKEGLKRRFGSLKRR